MAQGEPRIRLYRSGNHEERPCPAPSGIHGTASAKGKEEVAVVRPHATGRDMNRSWRASFAGIVRIRFQGLDRRILSAASAPFPDRWDPVRKDGCGTPGANAATWRVSIAMRQRMRVILPIHATVKGIRMCRKGKNVAPMSSGETFNPVFAGEAIWRKPWRPERRVFLWTVSHFLRKLCPAVHPTGRNVRRDHSRPDVSFPVTARKFRRNPGPRGEISS